MVIENDAFGLEVRKGKEQQDILVIEILGRIEINDFDNNFRRISN